MTRLGLLSLAAFLGLAPNAAATVIGFDDIITGTTVLALPATYGGISFSDPNFGVYGFADGIYTAHSPSNRVLTNRLSINQTAISFNFLTPVIFDGAWFAGSAAAGNVSLQMSLNNVVQASSSSIQLTPTYTFLESGYVGLVDQVTIYGIGGFYVFDDITYRAEQITGTEVPEPSTAALLTVPLLGAAWLLHRRRSTACGPPAN